MKKAIFTVSAITLALTLAGCNDSKESIVKNETSVTEPSATEAVQKDLTQGMAQVPTPAQQATPAEAQSPSAATSFEDYLGTYTGALPCEDCISIKTTLTLNADKTYVLEETYIGDNDRTIESKGTASLNSGGTILSLHDNKDDKVVDYSIKNHLLTKLDSDGKAVGGLAYTDPQTK